MEINLLKTVFNVDLNGKDSSVHVTSRSVAKDNSFSRIHTQMLNGNSKCFGHVECDAIIMVMLKLPLHLK